ncbi:hypothetical protein VPHD480_0148 [Vibrio phage D480]
MRQHELQELVEKHNFDFDIACNEYNETHYQVVCQGNVIFESYNEYCVVSFLEGVQWVRKGFEL